MRPIMRLQIAVAAALLSAAIAPQLALAGMGNAASAPTYHPDPCQGDACRGDDARSGLPCEGLLCTFSSAKAMQPPMTAKAAEAQQAVATTETIKPIDAAIPKPTKVAKRKAKTAAKTKVSGKTEAAATAPR